MNKVLKKDKLTGKILGWYKSIYDAGLKNNVDASEIKLACESDDFDSNFSWEYTNECYCCKWGKWWVTECENE